MFRLNSCNLLMLDSLQLVGPELLPDDGVVGICCQTFFPIGSSVWVILKISFEFRFETRVLP